MERTSADERIKYLTQAIHEAEQIEQDKSPHSSIREEETLYILLPAEHYPERGENSFSDKEGIAGVWMV